MEAGKYDQKRHHSSARSKLCPFHPKSKHDIVKDIFGVTKTIPCTVKAGLDNSLFLGTEDNEIFLKKLDKLVEGVKETAIKAQLFASHYILHHMETFGKITNALFTQDFFYKAIQLVCGKNIRDDKPGDVASDEAAITLPLEEMAKEFENYKSLHAHTTVSEPPYSQPLPDVAVRMAASFTDHMVERYEPVTISYITQL